MKPVTISHNGENRTETIRQLVKPSIGQNCAYCGQLNGFKSLFRYGLKRDDSLSGSVSWNLALLCSIDCFRNYYN
jgi:hypothetical protein